MSKPVVKADGSVFLDGVKIGRVDKFGPSDLAIWSAWKARGEAFKDKGGFVRYFTKRRLAVDALLLAYEAGAGEEKQS